jgi:argininosuccinate lyase
MSKDIINKTVDIFKRSSSIAKLMMKKSLMERNRKQKFQHLGELAYSLYKTNVIKSEELKQMVKDLDDINKEIRKTSSNLSGFTKK